MSDIAEPPGRPMPNHPDGVIPASSSRHGFGRDLLVIAVVLGLSGGLVEGIGHMALQRFGVLDNVWYPIIWIAAFFNAALVAMLGLVLIAALSRLPQRSWPRMVALFLVTFAALLPPLALLLKEWIHAYAIFILTTGLAMAAARLYKRHEPASRLFFRRSLVWVASVSLLAFIGIQGGSRLREWSQIRNLPHADLSNPDILVIVIDALRADHLSSYGYGRPTSPTIDRLAAEGVLFEQAYAASSYTLPSHASILTGLYPRQHGVEWGTSRQQATAAYPTLGETLQSVGYRTAAFSGNTFWFAREHGFGRGFVHFDDYFDSFADMAWRTAYGRIVSRTMQTRFGYGDIPARKRAPDTNRSVLGWVNGAVENPFFIIINYMDVHDPYVPPEPYRSRFANGQRPGGLVNWLVHVPETLTPEQIQGEVDAYDGAISYVDDQIGKLVTSLQQRQSGRDLLLIITSDHGEEFGDHGGFTHGSDLYRELIHVPLIVWQPKRVPQAIRISRPVTNAAIPATIMAFLGAAELPYPGPPLQHLWGPDPPSDWPMPLAELKRRPWTAEGRPVRYGSMRSLVSRTWHYIQHDTLGEELYDWRTDPGETRNVAKEPESQVILAWFRGQFSK